MIQNQLEQTILASYLLVDLTDDCFKEDCRKPLDVEIFTIPFNKRIAIKINEAIKNKEELPLLKLKLEDNLTQKSYTGSYLNEFLDITARLPLSSGGLKQYTQLLVQKKVRRML